MQTLIAGNPVLLLFIILGIGFIIGNIKFGSFQLGSVAGVLLAGLLFGHLGFPGFPEIQSLGFVLFIFSVGYQAGPRFIVALRKDGKRYLTIALIVSVTGFLLAFTLSRYLEFEPGVAAGVLAGSLTSTPTLAAADDAVQSAQYVLPDGFTIDQVRTNITTAYAITYIFGLIGLILVIGIIPKIFRFNLEDEAKQILKQEDAGKHPTLSVTDIIVRAYRLENSSMFGLTMQELYDKVDFQFTIQKIRRDGDIFEPELDTVLQEDDGLSIVGVIDKVAIKELSDVVIGKPLRDRELLRYVPESAKICVTHKIDNGTKLESLHLAANNGVFVTRIVRLGVDIEVSPSVEIERGDVLHMVGPANSLDSLEEKLGYVERTAEQTDLSTFSWSVVIGILLGTITITILGVNIGLGTAGGLLSVGILVGYLRSLFPVIGRMSDGARWIFTELGLLLFMAGVGLRGGAGLVETLQQSGVTLLLVGMVVTLVPLFIAFIYGFKVLKMNPLMLLGAVVGAMTSGGALSVINNQAKSTVAGIGYTGAYAFANVFLTIAGALIILLS